MLTSIFEYLVSALGELLDWAIAKFLEVLNMNLSAYLEMFPLLDDVYNFAQKFAMAMLLFIAGRALALFWTHSITGSNLSDRPAGVLLRTLFGAIAIYEGGYILEFIDEDILKPFLPVFFHFLIFLQDPFCFRFHISKIDLMEFSFHISVCRP